MEDHWMFLFMHLRNGNNLEWLMSKGRHCSADYTIFIFICNKLKIDVNNIKEFKLVLAQSVFLIAITSKILSVHFRF